MTVKFFSEPKPYKVQNNLQHVVCRCVKNVSLFPVLTAVEFLFKLPVITSLYSVSEKSTFYEYSTHFISRRRSVLRYWSLPRI